MSVARLRALTHIPTLHTAQGLQRVEMSVARLRALTQNSNTVVSIPDIVEMSVARLRALTHQFSAGVFNYY